MDVMFCDMCGKILKICNEKIGIVGRCSCGFSKIIEVSSDEMAKKKAEIGKGVGSEKNLLATFPHKCKYCGHEKAEVIELGVWYSDEAGNIRYKCGKCGRTEGDKDNNT